MAFTVLVLARLFNAFNSRSERRSVFAGHLTDWRLFGAVGVSFGLQVLVGHLPLLNTAFGTVPLSVVDWLARLGIASVVLWADELRKLAFRGISAG